MNKHSYLSNTDPNSLEQLYQQYLSDPSGIDPQWRLFFEGFEFALSSPPGLPKSEIPGSPLMNKEFNVIDLINAYRERGHLFTQTNPVRTRRKYTPSLDHQNFGLTDQDLDTVFQAGNEIGIGQAKLRDIIAHLKQTYCQSIGIEYMYIRTPEIVEWLKTRMESTRNIPNFSAENKKQMLKKLIEAVGFEHFIRMRFPGQKRFSLEGGETLIPALDAIIDRGSHLGIDEYVIGMAHRGRLNVLANLLRKPYHKIFSEFESKAYAEETLLGDVKYHLGCTLETHTSSGKSIKLSIAPNPSHLEAVNPVVQGLARAKAMQHYQDSYQNVAPILIHGDASIAGQGIIYEILQMSQLEGYKTGGTIHLVINNQLGFTTNYLDARSSTYCTDVAKTIQSPIFHVNGDDVEAVVYTIELAMEFRQKFQRDVFIDLLCYRKYGHNESDEPRFTQPLLYKIIEKHPDPATIYTQKIIAQKIIDENFAQGLKKSFNEVLEKELLLAKEIEKGSIDPFLEQTWKGMRKAGKVEMEATIDTAINKDFFYDLAYKITHVPDKMPFFRKTLKMMQDRREMIDQQGTLDWAMGELMAYASLLAEQTPVRLSGQDVERGTFSHRHAVLKMEDSEEEYIPLNHISSNQARLEIYNSLLSEYGVLGFEYGFAMASPESLTIWEAQFGDFANGAQIIIDQFISSAEEKWKVMNGLVMLLPHGFEGQGPEHSSARMERFLNLYAENNIQIANCTTPANLFHLLRRQMKRDFRKPLIIFTPKSLLRHPQCLSPITDFTEGMFQPLIDDPHADTDFVERVILCSGKIYYELLDEQQEKNLQHTAIVRLEQIAPLPEPQLKALREKYHKAKRWVWVQEEPLNMGAWPFILANLDIIKPGVVCRPPSASPASGSSKFHHIQQRKIVEKAFEECNCENVCRECKQLCISHLKPILG